jgi:5-methylcytosine-specific restriction protein A
MPYKPKRLRNELKKVEDKARGSSYKRGYNKRWYKARAIYLKEHPICECNECMATSAFTTANVIHHKIDHKGDANLFWEVSNWQALSKRCHDKITRKNMNKR